MAVINKLRNSGIVVIVIIFALAAFIIGDLIANYQKQGGKIEDNAVGYINGEPIQTGEFEELYTTYEKNMQSQSQGAPLRKDQIVQAKSQAWNYLFSQRVLVQEYNELGLEVGQPELQDLLFGQEPHATMKYFFGPLFKEGEEYNSAKVKQTVTQMVNNNPEARMQVIEVTKSIKSEVISQKYAAMVKNSSYTTSLEAKREQAERYNRYEGKIVSLKTQSISQDSIQVSDAELNEYLENHKEEYEQEKSVDFEFVKWTVIPSSRDTMEAIKWVEAEYPRFENATNDSIYLELNSDRGYDTGYSKLSELPQAIAGKLNSLTPGMMIGPDYENGTYSIYKVLEVAEDTNYYMNTSHILFKTGPGIKEEDSKKKANDLLAEIKSKKKSWEEAVKQSEDYGSVPQDGYIGWFTDDGQLVQEFVDFAKTRKKGDIGITKSQFGYHIIKINENKTNKQVKYGSMSYTVEVGRETKNGVLNKATQFRSTIDTKVEDAFQKHAEANKMFPSVATKVDERNKTVNGIAEPKNITDWAFDTDREAGDISPVLTIGNTMYVVHLSVIREEGYAKLDDVRTIITEKVRNEKIIENLKKDMIKAMDGAESIEGIAINLKTIANDLAGFSVAEGNIPTVGIDNKLAGSISASEKGQITGPIAGKTGVFAYIITSIDTESIKDEEIDALKDEMSNSFKMGAQQNAETTLKIIYDVKDYRYKFNY